MKRWMPSNAEEGDAFHEAWCANCQRDNVMNGKVKHREGGLFDEKDLCSILTESYIGNPIPQWVEDKSGSPVCMAFILLEKTK